MSDVSSSPAAKKSADAQHTRASDHQLYAGRPKRGTPAAPLSELLISSAVVNMLTTALARVIGSADVLQTVVLARGPAAQSGKAYAAAGATYVMAKTMKTGVSMVVDAWVKVR